MRWAHLHVLELNALFVFCSRVSSLDVWCTLSHRYSWSFILALFDIYFGLSVSLFVCYEFGLRQDNFSSVLP
jgi:hypothetical protein